MKSAFRSLTSRRHMTRFNWSRVMAGRDAFVLWPGFQYPV